MSETYDLDAESSRTALLQAGLRHFGESGYEGTSIRKLAATAQTNVASISYYFGNKAGLRRECAHYIVQQMRTIASPVLTTVPEVHSAAEASSLLQQLITTMIRFMVSHPTAGNITAFMLREITYPGEPFEIIYEQLLEPVHRAICELWATATGTEPHSAATRLTVFSMFGQILYFRLGSTIVKRRLDWPTIGEQEVDEITQVVLANLQAMLKVREETP